MRGFSVDEIEIIEGIRGVIGEEVDEYECLEAWEEMMDKF